MDTHISEVAKKCKERYKIFQKIRSLLGLEESSDVVRSKLKRYMQHIVHRSDFDGDIDRVVGVVQSHWDHLFYTYDDDKIPRTIQNQESFNRRIKHANRRITGKESCRNLIELYGPFEVLASNFLPQVIDGKRIIPLEQLGLNISISEILKTISYECIQEKWREIEDYRERHRKKLHARKNIKEILKNLEDQWNKLQLIKKSTL